MGRILFIRVSAATYDERAVQKVWPKLCALVWPDVFAGGAGSPADSVRKVMGSPVRGVLELVDTLVEHLRFGDLTNDQKSALAPFADTLASQRERLDVALGNRDVSAAHALTNSIEDALDDAEKACPAA